jgi:hypothetical protein
MTSPLEDEFTELVDADIPRVDLVDKAANGTRFLIAKQADGSPGLMPADLVRDLIGKSQPEPAANEETVTMTGSPAAIAKMIHQAAQRATEAAPVAKAKYNADDLRRMEANGEAMDGGAYPIADREDLENAIHAVGRGGADHDAIRRHIEARAKALDATSLIPDNWAADGSLKKESAVADTDTDLDPTVILAEPDSMDAPGNPTTPGSPAWEAIDAATARKWTSILARARSAVDLLAEREMLEATAGDDEDAYQAMDLQDACCALDYAISVLAPFAVAEQAEADCGEEMAAVGKALADFDTAPLDTIEALTMVTKAGRVLSTANEAAIRGAVESLQKVLASLPAAPADVEKTANEEPNMPQPTTSADTTAASGQEPAMGTHEPAPQQPAGIPTTEPVGKADSEGKTPMVAVYDAKGRLVGIVDPSEITPISGADTNNDEPDTVDSDQGNQDDLTPEPPADAGTPAETQPNDDINKTTHTTSDEMLKSSLLNAITDALKDHSAAQTEQITKTGDAVLELADLLKGLQDRVGALEEQPAMPKVFTNGAVPTPQQLRGQDQGRPPIDIAKARELKQELYRGTDAAAQNRASIELQEMAIDRLSELRRRP